MTSISAKTCLASFCLVMTFSWSGCKRSSPSRLLTFGESANQTADLPIKGRSLFDQIMYREETRRIEIPYPFDRFLARVAEQLQYDLNAPLIPFGRSLQRRANIPNVFEFPRVVFSILEETSMLPTVLSKTLEKRRPLPNSFGKIFIAYSEAAQAMEIISYNDLLGRFEFQIIEKYTDKGPATLLYAQRAVCTPCHQGGGPIFAAFGWSETNLGANSPEVKQSKRLLAQAHKNGMYYSIDVTGDSSKLLPESAFKVMSNAIVFDPLVRAGHTLIEAGILWRDMCSPADPLFAKCRADLVGVALSERLFGTPDSRHWSPIRKRLDDYRAKKGNALLELPSSVIADHSPYVFDQDGIPRLVLDPAVPPTKSPLSRRRLQENAPDFPSANDLAVMLSRGQIDVIPKRIGEIWFDKQDVEALKQAAQVHGIDLATKLPDAIASLGVRSASSFTSDVYVHDAVLTDLWLALALGPPQLWAPPTNLPEMQLAEAPPAKATFKSPVLALFGVYCAECHAAGRIQPTLLAGNVESEGFLLNALARNRERVVKMLSENLMPPKDAKAQPLPEERAKMIDSALVVSAGDSTLTDPVIEKTSMPTDTEASDLFVRYCSCHHSEPLQMPWQHPNELRSLGNGRLFRYIQKRYMPPDADESQTLAIATRPCAIGESTTRCHAMPMDAERLKMLRWLSSGN